jgi:hypothetical protein
MGGGFAGTVISRRGAEAQSFFGDGFRLCGFWEGRPPCRPVPLRDSFLAFGRDDLRVVRYRCGIRVWLLGGTTSVSSGTAAGVADITNSPYNLEF